MKFSCLIILTMKNSSLTICRAVSLNSQAAGEKSMKSLDSILALCSQVLIAQHNHQGKALHMVQLLLTHLLWEIPLLFIPDSTFLHQLLSYTSAILPSLKMYLVPGACFYQLASWDIHWLTAGIHFAEMPLHGHLILETMGDQSFETQTPCYGQETSGSATISSHTST